MSRRSITIYETVGVPLAFLGIQDGTVRVKNVGDFPTQKDLAAAKVGAGEFATCLQRGLFRLGSKPKNGLNLEIIERPPEVETVEVTVYDLETGEFGPTFTLPQDQIDQNVAAGQGVIIGRWHHKRHRLEGGAVVDKPPADPIIRPGEVLAEAQRRLAVTDWMIVRAADPTSGKPVPDEVISQRAAIRIGCDALLEQVPIPADFRDDRHWG